MINKIKEKKERALGVKLFIKAERCNSPKCVMVRRPYRPGVHGKKRHGTSEFGHQLQEKQKLQIIFGLTNKQVKALFEKYAKDKVLKILEHRLDRVVFLAGLAGSPRIARQLVSHGHIMVNNRKTTIPSREINIGDIVSVRPESSNMGFVEEAKTRLKQYDPPSWLKVEKNELKTECVKEADVDEVNTFVNVDAVGEFYAR